MTEDQVLRCSECAAPVKDGQERCEYCGYWFKPKPIEEIAQEAETEQSSYSDIAVGHGFLESAIGLIIIISVIAAILPVIANLTTGITIAHSGFTPNANITSSSNGSLPLPPTWVLVFFTALAALIILLYAGKKI